MILTLTLTLTLVGGEEKTGGEGSAKEAGGGGGEGEQRERSVYTDPYLTLSLLEGEPGEREARERETGAARGSIRRSLYIDPYTGGVFESVSLSLILLGGEGEKSGGEDGPYGGGSYGPYTWVRIIRGLVEVTDGIIKHACLAFFIAS